MRRDDECGMPTFLPLLSIPIIAYLVLLAAMWIDALT